MSKKVEYTLGERIFLCLPPLFVMGIIWFLWYLLLGHLYALLFGVIPVRPRLGTGGIYADDWVYSSVLFTSALGMISTMVIAYSMVEDYKDNAIWYLKKSVLWNIILFVLLMIVTPRLSVQLTPQIFGFTDIKGEYVTNTKLYFFWIDKLGFEYAGDYKFETLDDAIQGLEYAKNTNNSRLYYESFWQLENFGFEKAINRYKDLTFQWYFVIHILEKDYNTSEYSSQKEQNIGRYMKNVSLIEYLKDSKDNTIKDTAQRISILNEQFLKGLITRETFLKETTSIFRKIYDSNITILKKNYSVF